MFEHLARMAESDDLLADMMDQAAAAVAGARGAYQTELDFSIESLDRLEQVLRKMHDENKATPIPLERLALLSRAFGAYVGETVRRTVGHGQWRERGPDGEPNFPLYLSQDKGIWPMVWVLKVIVDGDPDSLRFKARVAIDMLGKGSVE